MDERAKRLKSLLITTMEKVEPDSTVSETATEANIANNRVEAVCEAAVLAFDILMGK